MNTTRLLKLAPTMIVVAAMAYAAYSINLQTTAGSVSLPATPPPPSRGGDRPEVGTPDELSVTATGLQQGRNPFVALSSTSQGHKAGTDHASGPGARVDPYIALVEGLSLNATFVQGKTQFASINGKLYQQGQHLNDTGSETSSLVLAQVTPSEVVLEANGSRYRLGYPDQFRSPSDQPAAAGMMPRDSRTGQRTRAAITPFLRASRSRKP
jgi:hypothetical protein